MKTATAHWRGLLHVWGAGGCASAAPTIPVVSTSIEGDSKVLTEGFSNQIFVEGTRDEIIGVSSVLPLESSILITMGAGVWLDDPAFAPNRVIAVAQDNHLVEEIVSVEDIWDHSSGDPQPIGSNLWDVAQGDDGSMWLVDAGGNWVAQIAPDSIEARITKFPAIDGEEAVPTSVSLDNRGNAYVTLFRCQQPTVGKGGVAHVDKDGDYEIIVDNLTNPISVNSHEDSLFVLEFADDYRPDTGSLSRVTDSGELEVLVDQLNFPTDFAVADDGTIYLTLLPTTGGGEPGEGQLVRAVPQESQTSEAVSED